MRWYYVVNGEVVGPVRTHYLNRIYDKGLINGETYVFNSKVVADWTRMKHIAGLIDELVGQSKTGVFREERTQRKKKSRRRGKRSMRSKEKRKRKKKKRREEYYSSSDDESEETAPTMAMSPMSDTSMDTITLQDNVTLATNLGPPLTQEQLIVTVGDYVQLFNGSVGRVLFIGNVKHMIGEVLGIELISGHPGENDGSVDGKRYFQCEPNQGVFVSRRQIDKIRTDTQDFNQTEDDVIAQTVNDLNLCDGFDLVSFTMAVDAMGLEFTFEQMEKAYELYQQSSQPCTDSVEQLTVLLTLLKEPMELDPTIEDDSGEELELNSVTTRWRQFSVQQGVESSGRQRTNTVGDKKVKLNDMKVKLQSQLEVLEEIQSPFEDEVASFQKAVIVREASTQLHNVQETLNELSNYDDSTNLNNTNSVNELIERLKQLEKINTKLREQNENWVKFVKGKER